MVSNALPAVVARSLAELQHNDDDFSGRQQLDSGTDILRYAVELGDDQGFAVANLAEQRCELRALCGVGLAASSAADGVAQPEIHLAAGAVYFQPLVACGLLLGAGAAVCEGFHVRFPPVERVGKRCQKVLVCYEYLWIFF